MSAPRHSNQDADGYVSAPVGIALGSAGVDLRVSPRNRLISALSKLYNAAWKDERVFGRRNGHFRSRLRDGNGYQLSGSTHERGYGKWAYGHGRVINSERYPQPYQGKGIMTLGDQSVAWTGDRLLSDPGRKKLTWFGESTFWRRDTAEDTALQAGIPAYIPTAKLTPLIASNTGFGAEGHDGCIGRVYKLFVTRTRGVVIRLVSRESGQPVINFTFTHGGDVLSVRSVFSKGRFIVFFATATQIYYTSASEENPTQWEDEQLLASCDGDYDIAYINETTYLIAWRDGSEIDAAYFSGTETVPTLFNPGDPLGITGTPSGALGITVAPSGTIGIVYAETGTTSVECLDSNGVSLQTKDELDVEECDRCTISARWLGAGVADAVFVAYAHIPGGGGVIERVTVGKYTAGSVWGAGGNGTSGSPIVPGPSGGTDKRIYCNADIRTQAWRVGDETFCWLLTKSYSGIQDTYHLVGGGGTSVVAGIASAGEAISPETSVVCSVAPDPVEETYGFPDEPTTRKWFHVLPRADESSLPDGTVIVDQVDFDFLPDLRWSRFGAALYTAGAAVQTYDGKSFVESGWTQFPEIKSVTASNGAGSLGLGTNYVYRIYACWRNNNGELFRSPAITTGPYSIAGTDDTFTVLFTAMPFTSKNITEVFFEIYRNEGATAGTTFYLTGRVAGNTFLNETIEFIDLNSDATIRLNQSDPHNPAIGASVELEEIAPIGCEKIVAHGSRLWMAGGSIPDGVLSFSKLREVGEGLGWNDLAGTLIVDVSARPTVSIASMNDALVALQDSKILLQGGEGPDNLGNGGFPPPNTLPAADGALFDFTVLADPGLLFWSQGGPRLLSPAGAQIIQVGAAIEPLAKNLVPTGVVAVPGKREVRWYTADGKALLWDYTPTQEAPAGRWAVWTGLKVAGATLVDGLPALALTDGDVLYEDPILTDDGGAHFALDFATWEMRPSDLIMGNNLLTRVGLTGLAKGPHTLRVWLYYDGARHWNEYFEWAAGVDLDLTPIKDTGDAPVSGYTTVSNSPDGVYRFEKGVRRRPFSTVRARFSDGGAHTNTFEPHEASFDFGSLPGLARVPLRTFPVVLPADTTQTVANYPAHWLGPWFGV